MALTQQQIDEGRNWINTQWGGSNDATSGQYSPGSAFTGGVYDTSNDQRNLAVLGAGNAMGYSDADLAQITGLGADQISGYRSSADPTRVGIDQALFEANNGGGTQNGGGGTTSGYTGGTTYTSGGSQGGQLNYGGFYGSPGGSMLGNGSGGMASLPSLTAYTQNPYLKDMGDGLQGQFNRNLEQNTLPSLRGGAVAAGGVGGSRQGIAEGLAAGASNTGAANAITNLYGNDYEQQMGRNLQQYGMDQNFNLGQAGLSVQAAGLANQYDLGRRGIDLGYQNSNNAYTLGNKTADQNFNLGQQGLNNSLFLGNQGQMQNFYDANRGMDIQTAALGGNLTTAGNSGSWSGLQDAGNIYSPYTGYGSSTTTTGTNPGAGVGNGLATYQYGTANGWW
jgi:hypothetical protein